MIEVRPALKLNIFSLIFSAILLFGGCSAGNIEDLAPVDSNVLESATEEFFFTGISDGRAIAHNKVEIDFSANLSTEQYKYYLFIDNDENNKRVINLETTPILQNGDYRLIVTGLELGRSYEFKVRAQNKDSLLYSQNENSLILGTYFEKVSDFSGITKVSLLPGKTTTHIKVEWTAADFVGLFEAQSFDVIRYVVDVVSSPFYEGKFDEAPLDTIYLPGESSDITPYNHGENLQTVYDKGSPGTTYYFRVRAIHQLYDSAPVEFKPSIPLEKNSVYKFITTDAAAGEIEFDKQSFALTKVFSTEQGSDGQEIFSQLQASWLSASGTYDKYRLFIKVYGGADQTGSTYRNDDELKVDTPGTSLLSNANFIEVADGVINCQTATIPAGKINLEANVRSELIDFTTANLNKNLIECIDILDTSSNKVIIKGLHPYMRYQAKVVPCVGEDCSLSAGDNKFRLSNFVQGNPASTQKTTPILAPFEGLISNNIENPSKVEIPNQIKLKFNTFSTSLGYVDKFELYCVNPDNFSEKTIFPADGGAITGASYCDGLTLANASEGLRAYASEGSSDTTTGIPLNTISDFNDLGDVKEVYVKNVITDQGQKYCFAITPAIVGYAGNDPRPQDDTEESYSASGELRNAISESNVACIIPEIKTPSIVEFPGLNLSCTGESKTKQITWNPPSGEGLFDEYHVLIKEKNEENFNFAVLLDPTLPDGYEKYVIDPNDSAHKVPGTTGHKDEFTHFIPGKEYQVGVLTYLSSRERYSQFNTNIVTCRVNPPQARFREWTRAFAVGPKIDGRLPSHNYDDDNNPWPTFRFDPSGDDRENALEPIRDTERDARIYETIDKFGFVYEVNLEKNHFQNISPPGDAINYNSADEDNTFDPNPGLNLEEFDGKSNSTHWAASNTGIISLSWKEVQLTYDNKAFVDGQANEDSGPDAVSRIDRKFGYRIYRSEDYGVSWKNLTAVSGQVHSDGSTKNRLVHAINYPYFIRANKADPYQDQWLDTKDTPHASDDTHENLHWGFFTDFSVRYADSFKDFQRARIYLYKIVPVFNGVELNYTDNSSSPHHVIKVTLPPPNMSLIHRKMANRQTCLEMGKFTDDDVENGNPKFTDGINTENQVVRDADGNFDRHYRCPFSGLGAQAQDIPWELGSTVYDLGGDLLVDRFEMGCNMTRGYLDNDLNNNMDSWKNSSSYYYDEGESSNYNGTTTDLAKFNGYQGTPADTLGELSSKTTPFRGCVMKKSQGSNDFKGVAAKNNSNFNFDFEGSQNPYSSAEEPKYTTNAVLGDCFDDTSTRNYYTNTCQGTTSDDRDFPGNSGCLGKRIGTISYPGIEFPRSNGRKGTTGGDPEGTDPFDPTHAAQPGYAASNQEAPQLLFGNRSLQESPFIPGVDYRGVADRIYRHNRVAQAEFGAVLFKQLPHVSYGRIFPIGSDINRTNSTPETSSANYRSVNATPDNSYTSGCWINLAYIGHASEGGDGYINGKTSGTEGQIPRFRSRWFDIAQNNEMYFYTSQQRDELSKNSTADNLLNKTLLEVRNSHTLYDDQPKADGTAWISSSKRRFTFPVFQGNNAALSSYENDVTDFSTNRFLNPNRLHPEMKISHIMTSNNSKLPPLRGMNASIMGNLCNNQKIQVGILASGDNENDGLQSYQALETQINKKLMRRSEYIQAVKVQEQIQEVELIKIHQGSNETLNLHGDVGGGTFLVGKNTCSSNLKQYDEFSSFRPGIGAPLTSRMPYSFSDTLTENPSFLWTGSGALDKNSSTAGSSHFCQSKYGIQDLIGNIAETSSDRIICDYTKETADLRIGVANSDSNILSRTELTSFEQSASISDLNFTMSRVFFKEDLTLKIIQDENPGANTPIGTPGEATEWQLLSADNPDPDPVTTTPNQFNNSLNSRVWSRVHDTSGGNDIVNRPYFHRSSNVGFCSVITGNLSNFRGTNSFVEGSLFKPILRADGSAHPDILDDEEINVSDALAANTTRNGDGYFLSFGPNSIADDFFTNNTLSFSGIDNNYFSPVVGIPLTCTSYPKESDESTASPVNSCNNDDNLKITIDSYFGGLSSSQQAAIKVGDFPTFSSEIINPPTSARDEDLDFIPSTNNFGPGTYDPGDTINAKYIFNALRVDKRDPDDVTVTAQAGVDYHTEVDSSFYGGSEPDNDDTFSESTFQLGWASNRTSFLSFVSGGGYYKQPSGLQEIGLYGLSIEGLGPNNPDRGFRCSALVNTELPYLRSIQK